MGYEDVPLLKMLSLAEGLRMGTAETAESYNSPKIIDRHSNYLYILHFILD